jgi:two-component system, chemotaxis family, sensor kinase CheA
MDDLLREFLTETAESLDHVDAQLVRFEREPNNGQVLSNIFRLVHTIKGTCGFLGLPRLEALTHAAESLMGKFRDGNAVTGDAVSLILAAIDRIKAILDGIEKLQREPEGDDADLIARLAQAAACAQQGISGGRPRRRRSGGQEQTASGEIVAEDCDPAVSGSLPEFADPAVSVASQSIRVNIDTLDQLMTMVSELVLTRNQLLEVLRRHDDSEFSMPLQRLSTVTTQVQHEVLKTRMQPIGRAWQKLPRIVRDLSAELEKDIALEMDGVETELDRQVLDLIKDPLTHLVRNCADHGIESPAERSAADKPRRGTIRLSASRQGGHIVIEIADDGRGLDGRRIKAKAIESGLASESEIAAKSQADINNLIFAPGFSTAAEVTSISGRGVGMDVVRNNIKQIGGTVDVTSTPGRGTSFVIKIPLTLAIVPALIVEIAGERFALPQLAVLELVRIGKEHRIEWIKSAPVLRMRHRLLPLIDVKDVLQLGTGDCVGGFVVVMQSGSQLFGAVVDNLFHTEEIVIKPMSSKLRHTGLFSGMTILGDGSVVLVIDPNVLAQSLGRNPSVGELPADAAEPEPQSRKGVISFLTFRAGSERPKAVPLTLISRIEEIDCRKIEITDNCCITQYRGQLIPLFSFDTQPRIKKQAARSVLIFSEQGRSIGLLIDEIVDIAEEPLDVKIAGERPGALGYALINGVTTEILDVGFFLNRSCSLGHAA